MFFTREKDLEQWLEEHYQTENELWIGYYRKATGRHCLSWSETVDIALCFGWIDGIRQSIDQESYKIRFTPRKLNSVWSAVNVEKVKLLVNTGKMRPAGLKVYESRKDVKGYSAKTRNIPLLKAYEDQIKAHAQAWLFFSQLAPSYKRDSIWWVMSAKKEETRLRRLDILITSSANQEKIPMLKK